MIEPAFFRLFVVAELQRLDLADEFVDYFAGCFVKLVLRRKPRVDIARAECDHGDSDGDGEVDVTDVVELIDMVLAGIYDKVGDINGDGEVDVTDVVELIDMVLSGE